MQEFILIILIILCIIAYALVFGFKAGLSIHPDHVAFGLLLGCNTKEGILFMNLTFTVVTVLADLYLPGFKHSE